MIISLETADFSANNIGKIDIPTSTLVSITITGESSASGVNNVATYVCNATYDNGTTRQVNPTWSISSGTEYASIDSSGRLSIKAGASASAVVVSASYNSKSATKSVTVTYDLNLNVYTTNAITASGNNNMTDTQKIALNTYFAALGAFGSASQIWSKIKYACLPVLASTVNKSMINYKDNEVIVTPSSNFILRNRGLVGNLSTMESADGTSMSVPSAKKIAVGTSYCVFAVPMESYTAQTALVSYNASTANNRFSSYLGIASATSKAIVSHVYVKPSVSISSEMGEDYAKKMVGIRIKGTQYDILKTSGEYATGTKSVLSDAVDGTPYINFLCSATSVANGTNCASIGVLYFGGDLTDTEVATLKSATEALVTAFGA